VIKRASGRDKHLEAVQAACEKHHNQGYVPSVVLAEETGFTPEQVRWLVRRLKEVGGPTYTLLRPYQTELPAKLKVANVLAKLAVARDVKFQDLIDMTGLEECTVRKALKLIRNAGEFPPLVRIVYRQGGRKKIGPTPCDLCGELTSNRYVGAKWGLEGKVCRKCRNDLVAEQEGKQPKPKPSERERQLAVELRWQEHEARHASRSHVYESRRLAEFAKVVELLGATHDPEEEPTYLKSRQARERENRAELCRRWFAEWQAIRETHSVCLIA